MQARECAAERRVADIEIPKDVLRQRQADRGRDEPGLIDSVLSMLMRIGVGIVGGGAAVVALAAAGDLSGRYTIDVSRLSPVANEQLHALSSKFRDPALTRSFQQSRGTYGSSDDGTVATARSNWERLAWPIQTCVDGLLWQEQGETIQNFEARGGTVADAANYIRRCEKITAANAGSIIPEKYDVSSHDGDSVQTDDRPKVADVPIRDGDQPFLIGADVPDMYEPRPEIYDPSSVSDLKDQLVQFKNGGNGPVCSTETDWYTQHVLKSFRQRWTAEPASVFQGIILVRSVDEAINRLLAEECTWVFLDHKKVREFVSKVDRRKFTSDSFYIPLDKMIEVKREYEQWRCQHLNNQEACGIASSLPVAPKADAANRSTNPASGGWEACKAEVQRQYGYRRPDKFDSRFINETVVDIRGANVQRQYSYMFRGRPFYEMYMLIRDIEGGIEKHLNFASVNCVIDENARVISLENYKMNYH